MNRHALRRTLAAALLASPAAFAAASADAAPQVLALFSTDRPVALACDDGTCRAEMPTLCLQPGRRVPRPGRGYRLAEGQEIVLVGRGRDGTEMSIPLTHEVTVTAARTHVSVEMSIPRALIDKHGIEEAGVGIRDVVAAVPVADPDDILPQTPDEIAWAAREARQLATAIVDREPDRMPAVRLMTRMANALPAGDADALWATMVADAKRDGVSDAATGFARFNYDLCKFKTANRIVASFRQCLQGLSDDSMEYLNEDLERALGSGS